MNKKIILYERPYFYLRIAFKRPYFYLKIALILIGCAIASLWLFSPVSAYTLDQQNQVCVTLNMTFVECYNLWDFVANYPNNTFSNCTNQTVYINQTQNVTVYQDVDCNQSLDFVKQSDATKIRLAEIEKGVSAECVVDSNSISAVDCEVQKAEQFQLGRTGVCPDCSSTSSSDFKLSDYYWLIFIIGLVVVYFGYKFMKSKSTVMPQSALPYLDPRYTPQIPILPPVPSTREGVEGDNYAIQ